MIILTTLEGFKPISNYVLVGNPTKTDTLKSGLYIDTTYKPEHHVEIINEVIAVPDRLSFKEWETEMELKVGDQVWVNYLSIMKGERVMVGDKTYILVPYEKIILAKRGDDIVMLNGYVLIEPVLEDGGCHRGDMSYKELAELYASNPINSSHDCIGDDIMKDTLTIIPIVKPKEFNDRGIVRYLGTPNKRYAEEHHSDDIDVNIGDMVVLQKGYYSKIESSYHAEIGNFLVTQRRRIVAKYGRKSD